MQTHEGQGLIRGDIITESIPQPQHDWASLMYSINNTPCVSEWDVSMMLKGSLAPNQTKWIVYSFIWG